MTTTMMGTPNQKRLSEAVKQIEASLRWLETPSAKILQLRSIFYFAESQQLVAKKKKRIKLDNFFKQTTLDSLLRSEEI